MTFGATNVAADNTYTDPFSGHTFNWVYTATLSDGSTIYYDSNSVKIDRNNKEIYIAAKIIFSDTGKQLEIKDAKTYGYYCYAFEYLSYLGEDLKFHYDSNTIDFDYYIYRDTSDLTIHEGHGPYAWPIADTIYGEDLIYQKLKKDFKI
jgi:hypothetical protein